MSFGAYLPVGPPHVRLDGSENRPWLGLRRAGGARIRPVAGHDRDRLGRTDLLLPARGIDHDVNDNNHHHDGRNYNLDDDYDHHYDPVDNDDEHDHDDNCADRCAARPGTDSGCFLLGRAPADDQDDDLQARLDGDDPAADQLHEQAQAATDGAVRRDRACGVQKHDPAANRIIQPGGRVSAPHGITVSTTLVRNVLARAGIPPAPERAASSWRSFLRQQGNTILACDLFTVDTVWLRRLYLLFFVSIGTRRVEYVACTSKPDTSWMSQQARNLLMDLADRSQRPRFLIHDRDTKFSRAFDSIFRSEGIEIVRTPIQAPNANAYAERWVGSVRRECLDRLLIFGRRQLEHVLRVYIGHFNQQRPHRALNLRPPDRGGGTDPPPTATLYTPQVRRRDLLGALLHEYEAAA